MKHDASPHFLHAGGPTEEALYDFHAGRLSGDAARWISEHIDRCARCAQFGAQLSQLHAALEPPPENAFRRQAALTAVRRRLEDAPPRSRRGTFVTLGATLAVATAALLVLWPAKRGPSTASPSVAWVVLGMAERRAENGEISVAANEHLSVTWGNARVRLEGGASGARAHLEESTAQKRRLRLLDGRVALDVDPLVPDQQVVVVTSDAEVRVHGTQFLVERGAGGTAVAVERGAVRVVKAGTTTELTAGQQLPAVGPKSSLSEEQMRAFERLLGTTDANVAAELPMVFEPDLAEATPRRVERSDCDRPLSRARVEVVRGAYAEALAQLRQLQRGALSGRCAARAALLEAEALRLSGRPEEAARILAVVARGKTSEAEQALVLVARYDGPTERSIKAWQEYRRRFPAGIFREEADYRVGEAMLRAGQSEPGLQALASYLVAYPSGLHTADAHLAIAIHARDHAGGCAAAMEHFSAASKAAGSRGQVGLIGMARCLAATGRASEARAAFLRYLEVAPDGRYAAEARKRSEPGSSP